MVGLPAISAEAAVEAGIDLDRLAIISPPEPVDRFVLDHRGRRAVGRGRRGGGLPGSVDGTCRTGVTDGDARRLTARARNKDAVLVLFGQQGESWPAVELKLSAQHGDWTGIGDGFGRLTRRRLLVSATGRGRSARPRTGDLWL